MTLFLITLVLHFLLQSSKVFTIKGLVFVLLFPPFFFLTHKLLWVRGYTSKSSLDQSIHLKNLFRSEFGHVLLHAQFLCLSFYREKFLFVFFFFLFCFNFFFLFFLFILIFFLLYKS